MLDKNQMSYVVYKFICAGCNACYIGETTRTYKTRCMEHLESDKTSAVYKHLKNSQGCKSACDISCFSILDKANTEYALRIKEALLVAKNKPDLNLQKQTIKVAMVL